MLSSCGEDHHVNASLNLITDDPNLIKALHNPLGGHSYELSLFLFPISIDK